MKEHVLPSGAKLRYDLAPFEDSLALYEAVMAEAPSVNLDPKASVANVIKDVFSRVMSSPTIKARVWKCMERALYNDIKITKATFEPAEARGDYFDVYLTVGREAIEPFMKDLIAKYSQAMASLGESPALGSTTNPS